MESFNDKFRVRTQKLAVGIIKYYTELKKTDEIRILGKQLMRSATSSAANFRAPTRARSKAEYYAKISIVIEEADETLFWIEMLEEAGLVKPGSLNEFKKEITELVSVFAKTRKTLNTNKLKNNQST